MSSKRHYAALQQEGRGPNRTWRLVNLAGRRPARAAAPALSNGLYWLYEMSHAALNPARAFADVTRLYFKNPLNPLAHTTFGKIGRRRRRNVRALDPPLRQAGLGHRFDHWSAASACRFTSPRSGSGRSAGCCISSACSATCRARPQPKLLIVAPMSGHYATLLRGTVEAFLPNHDVYITEWVDARMVPLSRRPLRSRRLHRLRHQHPASPRRRYPCRSRSASRRCRCSRRSR